MPSGSTAEVCPQERLQQPLTSVPHRIDAGQSRQGGHGLHRPRHLLLRQEGRIEGDGPHPGARRGAVGAGKSGQPLHHGNHLREGRQGNVGGIAHSDLAGPVHQQQLGGLAAPDQGEGGGGTRMAEGTLPLHEHEGFGGGPSRGLQYGLLHRPGRVVDPHRIQGHAPPLIRMPA